PSPPAHHRTPCLPHAGRRAVRPTGCTPAAGRLTYQSGRGLGAREQTAARRCETLPRWTRGSESRPAARERLQTSIQREASCEETDATLWHMQRCCDAEEWECRGERWFQTHEVMVVNALAYAEALWLRLVQTMGQRARRERLVHTCVGVQHTAKTGVRHT